MTSGFISADTMKKIVQIENFIKSKNVNIIFYVSQIKF